MIQNKAWFKYTFEFLTMFIAVIAAFALNNWNDNRRDSFAEKKTLQEINIGLKADLNDVELNMMGHKRSLRALNFFRDCIQSDSTYSVGIRDSLLMYYQDVTRDFIAIQNTSAYESLKSRGLELIEDDSLRSRLIQIYEFDYNVLRKFEEEYFSMQYFRNYQDGIRKAVANHLEFTEKGYPKQLNLPLTLSSEEKQNLLLLFHEMEMNRLFVLQYYQGIKEKIRSTSNYIKHWLDEN